MISIFGCTDSLAINYDSLATTDDGSCFYCDDTLITFVYSGSPQSFIVPTGLNLIKVHAYGAEGEDGDNGAGGLGGYVTAEILVSSGDTLNIFVGSAGNTGGYNGGGSAPIYGGTGGGATDIRMNGSDLSDRIIVAGGGGGGGRNCNSGTLQWLEHGGDGGGLVGGDGSNCSNGGPGLGGTQTSGGNGGGPVGTFGGTGGDGVFGIGGSPNTSCCGGGGGGGYYGGGAGAYTAGGGGSSYTIPTAFNIVHQQGMNSGNGFLIIEAPCRYGCTDSLAFNYDANALIDDSSCIYPIYGCTDSLASNYDPFATIDNGICLYSTFIFGCTDTSALNYDPLATVDDSSCCYNSSQIWTQIGQDINGEALEDESGTSISTNSNGNIVAIGAPFNDDNGIESGHVRVFNLIGSSWIQLGQDIDGEDQGDWSGNSVSLSSDGSTLAIGAPRNSGDIGVFTGHVRIYNYDGSSWVQIGQDINGEGAYDQSGCSVS